MNLSLQNMTLDSGKRGCDAVRLELLAKAAAEKKRRVAAPSPTATKTASTAHYHRRKLEERTRELMRALMR